MKESDVVNLIGEALGFPPGKVTAHSVAADFAEWDSMGTLTIVTLLDREGVRFDPGDMSALQSVQGVLGAFRKAGRLE